MSIVKVEFGMPDRHLNRDIDFDRVPVIGEYVYTDETVWVVAAVFHPLAPKGAVIIRVKGT